MVWLVLAVSLLFLPIADNEGCMECNVTVFELRYQDQAISEYDTKEECESALEDIEAQTPPFSKLECVETWVLRNEA